MKALENIPRGSLRTHPLVWVQRIVLFKSLEPLALINDIPRLGTGLNIVWGVEEEQAGPTERFEPGHGVGKTTLCRLIRFCLGERTYGQKHAAKEIVSTFPAGYVALEVWVQGRLWSVLRPFDRRRIDSAQVDVGVEQLIENRPPRGSFAHYRDHLARVCLEGLRAESVLTNGASIEWDHLLAMCTRDQESRYQSLWNWRSARSDSEWPAFKQPKIDALLCLRSVLGLLPEEETKLQQKLQTLAEETARLDEAIAERRREPEYWVRKTRHSLDEDFGIENASKAPLNATDLFGLPQLVARRIQELKVEFDDADERLPPLERQISMAAIALQEPAELKEQEEAAADATDEGTATLLKDLRELESLKKSIVEAQYSLCQYGQISIGDCSYAQKQLADADQQLWAAERTQLPISAERDQIAAALRERAGRKAEMIERLRKQLSELISRRDALQKARQAAGNQIKALEKALAELQRWDSIAAGREPDSNLATLVSDRIKVAADEKSAKTQLSALLSEQDQRSLGIRQLYEALVKQTLSPDFHGRVHLSSEGLAFQVFRGENLSGEAFETLSILLADLAALLMGAYGTAKHPGFLIHDSPREADLGGVIYRRLLETMSDVAAHLRGEHVIPFQYIVTTTTPPPERLQGDDVTRLVLGGRNGPLFGQQLHAATPETQPLLHGLAVSDIETH